ncbi:hypothetical protein Xen7305DRAFT_00008110 [Xenococcus sp. PCC 7305]|nr:hypothetical protein Xen7305DRAFT_00008110 [Xenococcus sp. PCC 7305]
MDLPREELRPNSCLRVRMSEVENDDTLYSTTIVEDIQGYLSEIAEIDGKIVALDSQSQAKGVIEEIEIKDDYSVQYQASQVTDATAYLRRRRNILMGKLYRDLGYRRPTYTSSYVRS